VYELFAYILVTFICLAAWSKSINFPVKIRTQSGNICLVKRSNVLWYQFERSMSSGEEPQFVDTYHYLYKCAQII
jgi:hypothetical protein